MFPVVGAVMAMSSRTQTKWLTVHLHNRTHQIGHFEEGRRPEEASLGHIPSFR